LLSSLEQSPQQEALPPQARLAQVPQPVQQVSALRVPLPQVPAQEPQVSVVPPRERAPQAQQPGAFAPL
jgi:hypothetical protein